MQMLIANLEAYGFDLAAATADRAQQAAIISSQIGVPYADAFGIQLAEELPGSTLITADFDFKPASHLVPIEFLATKSTP